MQKLLAIFFDLDNTLIDRNAAFKACMLEYFKCYLPDFNFDEEWNKIQQKDNWGYTKRAKFSPWFVEYFSPVNQTIDDFWEFQRLNISTHISPLDSSIVEQLKRLKNNYKIGILTNGGLFNQSKKIKNSKLDQIFLEEEIIISEQYQIKKPDAAIFQLLLDQLQIPANQLLYVGDDPLNDIWGAQQLGIKTAWISWERKWEHSYTPDYIFNNLKTTLDQLCHTI